MLFSATILSLSALLASQVHAVPTTEGLHARTIKGQFSLQGRALNSDGDFTAVNACNGTFFLGAKQKRNGCPDLSYISGKDYRGPTKLLKPKPATSNSGELVVDYRGMGYYISAKGSLDTTGYEHGEPPYYSPPQNAYKGQFTIENLDGGAFYFNPKTAALKTRAIPKIQWHACSGPFANGKTADAPVGSGIYKVFAAVTTRDFPKGAPGKAGCFPIEIKTQKESGEGPEFY